jgi:hypothetical protein
MSAPKFDSPTTDDQPFLQLDIADVVSAVNLQKPGFS